MEILGVDSLSTLFELYNARRQSLRERKEILSV